MEFIDLTAQPASHLVGSKAARLGWLMSQGWPVPPGRVAPFEATDQIVGGTAAAALEMTGGGACTVSVMVRESSPVTLVALSTSVNVPRVSLQ